MLMLYWVVSYVNTRGCNGMWEAWVKQMCGSRRSYGFTKFWLGSINFGCGFKISHGFKIWCGSKICWGSKICCSPNFGVGSKSAVVLKLYMGQNVHIWTWTIVDLFCKSSNIQENAFLQNETQQNMVKSSRVTSCNNLWH